MLTARGQRPFVLVAPDIFAHDEDLHGRLVVVAVVDPLQPAVEEAQVQAVDVHAETAEALAGADPEIDRARLGQRRRGVRPGTEQQAAPARASSVAPFSRTPVKLRIVPSRKMSYQPPTFSAGTRDPIVPSSMLPAFQKSSRLGWSIHSWK